MWRKNLIEQKTNFFSIFLLKGQHKSPNQCNFEVKDKHNILKGTFSQAQIHPFQYQQNNIQLTGEKMVKKKKKVEKKSHRTKNQLF